MTDKEIIHALLVQQYSSEIYSAYHKDLEKGVDYFKGKQPTWTQVINMYDPLGISWKRVMGLN